MEQKEMEIVEWENLRKEGKNYYNTNMHKM